MTASFRLGRIAGVPVGVNWSVLIIFLLIWWGLSAGSLPAAYPAYGGRLLRAALWKWRGDRPWAAIAAARAGRVFGAGLIAFGLWQFLLGGGFGGLWLALIGWFLFGAAGAEQQQTRITESLAGVRVGDVMSVQPQTVPPDLTVAEFVDHHLWQYRHTAFPLTEAGRPVGLVTMDRIRHVPAELRQDITLREVACPADELILASPHEPLKDLLPRLHRCADGRALVVTDDQLVGIVSHTDISRAVQHSALRQSATSTRRY